MPTIIFNHGAWHTPECWTAVKTALQQQGHRCHAPALDFSNTPQPVESLASSINQIQDLIRSETNEGNDVVLVNHSFGGSVGCSAAKGFTQKNPSRLSPTAKGKVVGIIQLCAFMPPAKTALYDVLDMDNSVHHPGPDGWEVIDNGDPEVLFYNDLPAETAKYWIGRLQRLSSGSLGDRENVYPGWADVPVWYLICTRDQAIPVKWQEAAVNAAKEAGADIRAEYLDCGHSPFLSRVDETVRFIGGVSETLKEKV